MPRTIHVTCGYGVPDRLIKDLSIARTDVVSLGDNLSCGPLGPLTDLGSWRTMRRAFWEHIEREPPMPDKRKLPRVG